MEFARNLFFGVDNSLSSHTDNWKNNFLVLDEGPTDGVNDSAVQLKKNLVLKKVQFLSLHNSDESYLYVNKTEICKFKVRDNISCYNSYLGKASKVFTKQEQSEFSINCKYMIF